MKNILSMAVMLSVFCLSLSAQTVSTAKQINKIKKDKKYLYAESTDVTEDAAYTVAKSILDGKVDEFIQESGISEGASTIIVKDIRKTVQKHVLQRGAKFYVFLYVKQSDIIKSEADVETITINNSEEKVSERPTIGTAVSSIEHNDGPKVEPVEETTEIVEAPVHAQQPPIAPTNDYLSKLPKYRQHIINNILEAKDLIQVQNVIKEEMLIQNYGVMKDCPNSDVMFWVVKDKNGLTVLSPVKKGGRVNVKTGKYDKLGNYEDGIWIRFK